MSLNAAIEAELPGLRAEAESRMKSRAVVRRLTGDSTTNPDGFVVDEWADVHVDLPLRVGGADAGASGTRTVSVGGSEVQVAVRTVSFPASTTDLADDDLIVVTSGENVGAILRIVEADWQDQATARRVPVVAEQEPEGWV